MLRKISESVNQGMTRLAVLAATAPMGTSAWAQGFTQGARNLTQFFQVGVGVVIAAFVLGGLAMIGYGAMQMVKKGDRGNDDVTWMSIGLKLGGGALMLALSWVGVMVLETLGGGRGDIGRPL